MPVFRILLSVVLAGSLVSCGKREAPNADHVSNSSPSQEEIENQKKREIEERALIARTNKLDQLDSKIKVAEAKLAKKGIKFETVYDFSQPEESQEKIRFNAFSPEEREFWQDAQTNPTLVKLVELLTLLETRRDELSEVAKLAEARLSVADDEMVRIKRSIAGELAAELDAAITGYQNGLKKNLEEAEERKKQFPSFTEAILEIETKLRKLSINWEPVDGAVVAVKDLLSEPESAKRTAFALNEYATGVDQLTKNYPLFFSFKEGEEPPKGIKLLQLRKVEAREVASRAWNEAHLAPVKNLLADLHNLGVSLELLKCERPIVMWVAKINEQFASARTPEIKQKISELSDLLKGYKALAIQHSLELLQVQNLIDRVEMQLNAGGRPVDLALAISNLRKSYFREAHLRIQKNLAGEDYHFVANADGKLVFQEGDFGARLKRALSERKTQEYIDSVGSNLKQSVAWNNLLLTELESNKSPSPETALEIENLRIQIESAADTIGLIPPDGFYSEISEQDRFVKDIWETAEKKLKAEQPESK